MAWLVNLAAVLLFSPWTGALAFLFCLLASVYGFGGVSLTIRMLPAWLFCFLVLPLPFRLDVELITSLQTLTARWSSRLLDALGVMHVLAGNTVELPGRKLEVEEACSGVHSLFACFSVTLFFALWMRRSLIRGGLLLLSAVGWVLVANSLRVVLVACLEKKGIPASEGFLHEMLGIGVFVFTMVMVLSTDRLILFFLPQREEHPKSSSRQNADDPRPTFLPTWRNTWLATRATVPLILLFGLLATAQGYMLAVAPPEEMRQRIAPETFANLNEGSLPANWGKWQRVGFDTQSRNRIEAEYSRYWTFDSGTGRSYASIDYPFYGWHDLLVCYRATGWTVAKQILHTADGSDEERLPFVEVEMSQPPVSHGYLLFYSFDDRGRPLDFRSSSSTSARILDRISNVRANWNDAGQKVAEGKQFEECYQVQLFVENYAPLTDADRKQAQEFFRVLCQEMRGKWLAKRSQAQPSP